MVSAESMLSSICRAMQRPIEGLPAVEVAARLCHYAVAAVRAMEVDTSQPFRSVIWKTLDQPIKYPGPQLRIVLAKGFREKRLDMFQQPQSQSRDSILSTPTGHAGPST